MAMVIAIKGDHKIKVSRKSFEASFKPIGYKEIRTKASGLKQQQPEPEERGENLEIDIDTIPVSDMDKEQLREYARVHGIDISGTRSPGEARKVIQAAMRNQ